ncbi:hydroxypyruvate isomerase family protein [Nitratireductor indicus]|uniref:hydroxypyruvate isomerase family protein n=1 Tax=Nitratireductor indicus TaxID=721133 RepID=UPI0028764246|nr:TIM barrel protein [Nitratireductor indicus]MDS1135164.1 TIM barrel protein [Nitratireductor indicus]
MLRLSANLSTLFREYPFRERFGAARRAGFKAVEVQYPYEFGVDELASLLIGENLSLVLVNARKGSRPEDRGLACLRGRESEFRESVRQALRYSAVLGNRLVHVLSGVPPCDTERQDSEKIWLENMRWASREAREAGMSIVIEALNQEETPGYFLRSAEDACGLIDMLDEPGAGLLFDVYHCAKAGQDIVGGMERCLRHIRHIQIADAPERSVPGSGTIDWDETFAAIEALGYSGFIGCEYLSARDTAAELRWAAPYLAPIEHKA